MPIATLTAFTATTATAYGVAGWTAAAAGWGTAPNGDTGTAAVTHAPGSEVVFTTTGTLTDDGTTLPADAVITDVSVTYDWDLDITSTLELQFATYGAVIAAPGATGSANYSVAFPGWTRALVYTANLWGWTLQTVAGAGNGRAVVSNFSVVVTYTQPAVGITLNTLDARTRRGLTIHDVLNDAPNTCSLTVETGATSPLGKAIRIAVNPGAVLLFNGTIQTAALSYDGTPDAMIRWACTATDDLAQFNRRLPFGTWDDVSATTVGEELIAAYAPGFSDAGIEASLPNVTITLDGSTTMGGAFAQIAHLIGGAFKLEDGVAYLFLTDTADPPDDIDDTPGRFLNDPPITMTVDLSQIRTRVFVEGQIGTTGPTELALTAHPGFATATSTGQTGGGMLGEGSVAYVITHVTDRGETHPSGTGDSLVTFAPGEGSVLLEDLDSTIYADPRVTDRRLYRSRAGSQYPWYFLMSLGIDPVTNDTVLDSAANEALGAIAPTYNTTGFTPTPTVWAEVNDTVAQAALATLEGGGSDGIVEHLVRDSSLTTSAQAIARGEAELALFAYPLVTVTYATRDVKSKSGKTVHIEVTNPPIGPMDLVIQDVTISKLDLTGGPIFQVTASSVRFSLEAILRMALKGAA